MLYHSYRYLSEHPISHPCCSYRVWGGTQTTQPASLLAWDWQHGSSWILQYRLRTTRYRARACVSCLLFAFPVFWSAFFDHWWASFLTTASCSALWSVPSTASSAEIGLPPPLHCCQGSLCLPQPPFRLGFVQHRVQVTLSTCFWVSRWSIRAAWSLLISSWSIFCCLSHFRVSGQSLSQ